MYRNISWASRSLGPRTMRGRSAPLCHAKASPFSFGAMNKIGATLRVEVRRSKMGMFKK